MSTNIAVVMIAIGMALIAVGTHFDRKLNHPELLSWEWRPNWRHPRTYLWPGVILVLIGAAILYFSG